MNAEPLDTGAVECANCDDSGWVRFECAGADCGRHRRHQQHEYVRPCPCRPMNRTFQARHARGKREAA
jgi:hypothetical protein